LGKRGGMGPPRTALGAENQGKWGGKRRGGEGGKNGVRCRARKDVGAKDSRQKGRQRRSGGDYFWTGGHL